MKLKLLLCLSLISLSVSSWGITRQEVIDHAERYVNYGPWQVQSSHANRKYNNLRAGQRRQGVSYNWGGLDSVDEFDRKIRLGVLAGNLHSKKGIHRNFAGIDCSAFVSKVWNIGHHTTRDIETKATHISRHALKAGDALNKAGKHVRLFHKFAANGQIRVYESASSTGGMVHRVIAWDNTYKPIRLRGIQDGGYTGGGGQPSASAPEITAIEPMVLAPKPLGQKQWIKIYGNNFGSKPRLEFKIVGGQTFGNRIPHQSRSGQLKYYINVGEKTQTWEVRVISNGQASQAQRFEVRSPYQPPEPPPVAQPPVVQPPIIQPPVAPPPITQPPLQAIPVITSLSPTVLPTRPAGQRQPLMIYGQNFSSNPRLELQIVGGPTFDNRIPTLIASGQLQYDINVGPTEFDWQVRVVTDSGLKSAPQSFSVRKPADTARNDAFKITHLSPSSLPPKPAGQRQPLRIHGQGFTPDTKLDLSIIGGTQFGERQPTFVSATELLYNINVGPYPATWEVRVKNKGKTSNAVRLEVR